MGELAAVRADRPGTVTAAAVLVMVQAVVVGLAGLLVVFVVLVVDSIGDAANHEHHRHGGAWIFGIPLFAAGALTVLVGTRLLAGRSWAMALTLAADGVLALLAAAGAGSSSAPTVFVVTFLLCTATVGLLVLPSSRRWFARR